MENIQNTTNEVVEAQKKAPNNRITVAIVVACVLLGLVIVAGAYLILTQQKEYDSSIDITIPSPSSTPIPPPAPSVQDVAPAPAPVVAPTPTSALAPAQLPINSARVKGINAQIKANMANMRATAELHYDMNNYSYAGVCSFDMVVDSITAVNNVSPSKMICNDGPTYWVAEGQLQGGNGYFCVDSTGAAITYASSRGEAVVTCK